MTSEARFLVAIVLMLGVLVGTNLLFPPVPPPEVTEPAGEVQDAAASPAGAPQLPAGIGAAAPAAGDSTSPAETTESLAVVEGPLYRFTFSSYGARLTSAEMVQFEALNREGLVDLIPEGAEGYLGQSLLVGNDTVDLRRVPFVIEPVGGLQLEEGEDPQELRFVYQHPTLPFRVELTYRFQPDEYQIRVRGRVTGVDRPLLITDLGAGLAYAEADSVGESRSMAYVSNHAAEGIESRMLADGEPGVVEGPLLWAAFRSKFFVMALLAGEGGASVGGEPVHLGGLILRESPMAERIRVAATQTVRSDGAFAYRLFLGPQQYASLQSLGDDLEEVNPYGWRFFRPIIRPFVSIITTVLLYLHTGLNLTYGWVLVVFGVLMRVVLWPLNQKAMRAQFKNMAVQPLMQEIQAKYKDNPEKLQKEMLKLYKEHGFNPLAGCVPMLLPWPVLIALFFVFQNTIEFRGVSFLWLPDLSAPDPLYLLPVFMGVSMFLMQWVSLRQMETPNPQMKMMMWMLPIMMVVLFFKLASGLNLYYAVSNVATIPQQMWIAKERKKIKPVVSSSKG